MSQWLYLENIVITKESSFIDRFCFNLINVKYDSILVKFKFQNSRARVKVKVAKCF